MKKLREAIKSASSMLETTSVQLLVSPILKGKVAKILDARGDDYETGTHGVDYVFDIFVGDPEDARQAIDDVRKAGIPIRQIKGLRAQ